MRYPAFPIDAECATHSAPHDRRGSRTSVAARQAQLDAAMRDGREPSLPPLVLESRLEKRRETIRQAVAEEPTPALLEAARQADRQRSSFARGTRTGHRH